MIIIVLVVLIVGSGGDGGSDATAEIRTSFRGTGHRGTRDADETAPGTMRERQDLQVTQPFGRHEDLVRHRLAQQPVFDRPAAERGGGVELREPVDERLEGRCGRR